MADGRSRLDAHASTIEARCADHGIELAGLVTDDAADDRVGRERPGLAFAFEQLELGAADCLVVGRVGHLTGSPAELSVLLDTMPETPLVVLNADPAPRDAGRWARHAARRRAEPCLTGPTTGESPRTGRPGASRTPPSGSPSTRTGSWCCSTRATEAENDTNARRLEIEADDAYRDFIALIEEHGLSR